MLFKTYTGEDHEELLRLGRVLDETTTHLDGKTTGLFLAERFLRIRNRTGEVVPLVPNRAQAQEAAEGIFRIVHRFLESMPEQLRNGVLKTSKASSRQIVFPALDSEYRVETAGDANAGRGL